MCVGTEATFQKTTRKGVPEEVTTQLRLNAESSMKNPSKGPSQVCSSCKGPEVELS